MTQSTTTQPTDASHRPWYNELLQKLSKKQDSKPSFNSEVLAGTPFNIVSTDKGYFIAMGQQRLSPLYKNYKTLMEYEKSIMNINWETMTPIICILAERVAQKIANEK